ncbi:uncharacterized protein A4U43_C05F13840 [Asparagus officinalis]|uniref:Uncharacterized protein n=1 Tax=Asparagus officinalis TaxID=4686 RepID=A0A5P1ERG0_ASPOF|nr:uncharacterized protein A4U43_C05F13840 [Asparagus officinalis]
MEEMMKGEDKSEDVMKEGEGVREWRESWGYREENRGDDGKEEGGDGGKEEGIFMNFTICKKISLSITVFVSSWVKSVAGVFI